jgi:hypothetical protein
MKILDGNFSGNKAPVMLGTDLFRTNMIKIQIKLTRYPPLNEARKAAISRLFLICTRERADHARSFAPRSADG